MTIQRSPELLRLLLEAQVNFVIIGGVAAIAHGSATFTVDFDIAAPLTEENLTHLMRALAPHHPRYALAGDKRPVTEAPAQLATNRNLYLLTDAREMGFAGQPTAVCFEQRLSSALQLNPPRTASSPARGFRSQETAPRLGGPAHEGIRPRCPALPLRRPTPCACVHHRSEGGARDSAAPPAHTPTAALGTRRRTSTPLGRQPRLRRR